MKSFCRCNKHLRQIDGIGDYFCWKCGRKLLNPDGTVWFRDEKEAATFAKVYAIVAEELIR